MISASMLLMRGLLDCILEAIETALFPRAFVAKVKLDQRGGFDARNDSHVHRLGLVGDRLLEHLGWSYRDECGPSHHRRQRTHHPLQHARSCGNAGTSCWRHVELGG